MKDKFKGIWPAMLTPVSQDGSINFTEAEKLVHLFIEQELDGIYILGSTGMGISFTEKDRKAYTEHILKSAGGKIPVMVHVGAVTTQESIRLAQHAEEAGANGLSSVGPIYYRGGADMTLAHYKAIARSVSIPFFPYQLGNGNSMGEHQKFLDEMMEVPNIVGMKLTTNELLQISQIYNMSEGKLKLFSGADELLCQAALCGTVGAIGSTYNLWGPVCKHIRQEFTRGNFKLAKAFMLTFQKVIDQAIPNFWSFMRQGIKLKYGIEVGPSIAPVGNVNTIWEEETVLQMIDSVDRMMSEEAYKS